jgi:hypothetical protein
MTKRIDYRLWLQLFAALSAAHQMPPKVSPSPPPAPVTAPAPKPRHPEIMLAAVHGRDAEAGLSGGATSVAHTPRKAAGGLPEYLMSNH